MSSTEAIQYLKRHQLDEARWNDCVSGASNGVVYGYSFYLDAMAGNWDALVLGNYKAVMPLPWRKKWGIRYLYQPSLTAQLGLFGNGLSSDLLSDFLNAVPKQFRYWDFPLNHGNLFAGTGFSLHERLNYVLQLNKPYEELYKQYRENIRRNCRKSKDLGCTVAKDIGLDSIIELTRFQAKELPQQEMASFKKLFVQQQTKGKAKTYGVFAKNGDLLSSAAFLFSHNRAYYILVGNHPNGRTLGASHALIDAFIHDHAGNSLLLDFEGSDIRNLAFFYSSFGAKEEKYAAITLNRLPPGLRWLKAAPVPAQGGA